MHDLYLAILASLLLSSALCALGRFAGRRMRRPLGILVMSILVAGLLWYAVSLVDNLALARYCPFPGVMILGNFTPEVVALMVGIGWGLMPGGRLRKFLILTPLVAVCLYKAYVPAFAATPVLGDKWDFGICMQTSRESCSAAAAATLLSEHGIVADEQEMARLCRTSHDGTSMLGLYRGLKLKTRGTPWDVEVVQGSVDQLRLLPGPLIVSVGLKTGQVADPRYAKEWGWEPGVKHTVVLLDFDSRDEVEVGDPNVGREHWSLDDLRILWYGEGLRLIRR